MTEGSLAGLARDALVLLLELSGPVLLVGLVVGLLVSMFQAVTQINESTLVFIPKLLAVGVTLALTGGFMMQVLLGYGRGIFDQVITIGLG
jgi:flagellar biosynthetic protein FliQ